MKKLVLSTFVPEGWANFQSFGMRSLRLRVICPDNRDTCLARMIPERFDSKGCAPKLLQFTHPSGLVHHPNFLTPSEALNSINRKRSLLPFPLILPPLTHKVLSSYTFFRKKNLFGMLTLGSPGKSGTIQGSKSLLIFVPVIPFYVPMTRINGLIKPINFPRRFKLWEKVHP